MTIIQKPRARCEGGVWLVWDDAYGPGIGSTLDEVYAEWRQRRYRWANPRGMA